MKHSAGIIPFRVNNGRYEFFVGHPGGPYWEGKKYWALLKGGLERNEDVKEAAIREFQEESGVTLGEDVIQRLVLVGTVKQSKQKQVTAFAVKYGTINPSECHSNMADFCDWPEIDSYQWVEYEELVACTHPTNVMFYEKIVQMDKQGLFTC